MPVVPRATTRRNFFVVLPVHDVVRPTSATVEKPASDTGESAPSTLYGIYYGGATTSAARATD